MEQNGKDGEAEESRLGDPAEEGETLKAAESTGVTGCVRLMWS